MVGQFRSSILGYKESGRIVVSGVVVGGRDGRKGSGAEVIMGSSESNLLTSTASKEGSRSRGLSGLC